MRFAWLAALLGAALVSSVAVAAEKANWTAYTFAPAITQANAKALAKIGEDVAKASDGELSIRLHLAGSLPINSTNITQAVADNVVQFGDDGFFQGNIPVGGILRLPMLINSAAEFEKAMAVMRPYLDKAYDKKGIVVLETYYFPLQVLWSRKKLASLDDIKGQKLRVSSPEQGEFVKRFGGSSITLAATEVPSALDRGVVDGVLTASSGGGKLWKDLLKFNYRTGPNYFDAVVIANKEAFGKLSPQAQEALRKLVKEQAPGITTALRDEEDEQTAKFKAEGMTVTAANPDDIKVGAERMASFWDQWAKAHGPDSVEALAKVRAALGR